MPVYAPKDDFGAIRDFPGVRKWSLGTTFSAQNPKFLGSLSAFFGNLQPTCFQDPFRSAPGHHFGRLWMDFGRILMDFDIIFDRFRIHVCNKICRSPIGLRTSKL